MELELENGQNSSHKQGSRAYSEEEKRHYCELWKNTGLSKSSFCKSNGLNNKTFSNWCKAHIKEDRNGVEFARVITGANEDFKPSELELSNIVQMEILNTAGSQIRINLSRLDALYIIKGLYDGN